MSDGGDGGAGRRDRPIDAFKGALVVAMVFGHVLQFFTPTDRFASAAAFVELANVVAFPGFVFAFGYAAYLAYLRPGASHPRRRLVRAALRVLLAFYLSGTAFRVLVDHRPPDLATLAPILLLFDVPGWSEFLVAFALYALLLAVALPFARALLERPPAWTAVMAVALLATFLPYERIDAPQLGLLVGTQRFAAFPVLQYLPFHLAGMLVARSGRGFDPRVLAVAALATIAAAASAVAAGELPGRFPPTLGWILLPMAPLYALLLACRAADRSMWPVVRPLAAIGARSLVYLLVSNVVIFAIAGTRAGPVLDLPAAAALAAVVLAATAYLIRLARRAG